MAIRFFDMFSGIGGFRSGLERIDGFEYKLNDHLYEGRYTPTNAYGKRESCNVYGKTYEECEAKIE